jgi:hypothetical protein
MEDHLDLNKSESYFPIRTTLAELVSIRFSSFAEED